MSTASIPTLNLITFLSTILSKEEAKIKVKVKGETITLSGPNIAATFKAKELTVNIGEADSVVLGNGTYTLVWKNNTIVSCDVEEEKPAAKDSTTVGKKASGCATNPKFSAYNYTRQM